MFFVKMRFFLFYLSVNRKLKIIYFSYELGVFDYYLKVLGGYLNFLYWKDFICFNFEVLN